MHDSYSPDDGWETAAAEAVRQVLITFNAKLLDWPADDDLINSRQLDSLIFVSVLMALEEASGREVDPAEVASAELRTIGGLARVFYGPTDGRSRSEVHGHDYQQ